MNINNSDWSSKMDIKTIYTEFGKLNVNLSGDYYGAAFWDKIESGFYEPDTIFFLKKFVNADTDFIDLGVANGAISLLAALRGARVLGFEAMPHIYRVATSNIEINDLDSQIELRNSAISDVSGGRLKLIKTSDPSILSSITFGNLEDAQVEIEVEGLGEAVASFWQNNRALVIKMDIEGAEWKILKNEDVVRCLKACQAVVLLAIHPGFQRPYSTQRIIPVHLSKLIWHLRNIYECVKVFTRISKYAKVLRTNLDLVRSPKRTAALMLGGYHEFILDFKSK